MDDNCGEWVECMGVASGCGEQEVGVASGSGWNLWVESMGVATGCGFKEIYRFPHTTYPYPSCICPFLQQHPYFLFIFLNVFRSCSSTGIPRHPYEGCTYCFIHEEAHTNVRFLSCDGHQLYERGVDLEVEGVRYIEMHRGPAAYVLGPPPSRSRDLELEGGVIACHVDYVYEPQDSHVRGTE